MRRKFLLPLLASLSTLAAQEQSFSYWDFHPWRIGGQLLRIGKANCEHNQGHVHYRKSNIFTTILLPIDYNNFFFPRVELNYVTFDWNKNPKFTETHFYYMQFGLTYYTTALDKWKWIARFDYNLQIEHMSHPGQYSLYSGLLWGAYQIHRKWNYHIGGLGYGGLEGGQVYPIIGVDFTPNPKWFFQALFPINYSAEFKPDAHWTLAIKIRPLKERLRVGSREPQPRSIFSYSSYGGEFNTRYELKYRLVAEAYGGVNFGGKFYVKDANGHNAVYVPFGAAPYFGASIDFGF